MDIEDIKYKAYIKSENKIYNVRCIDFSANKTIHSIRIVKPYPSNEEGDIDFDFPEYFKNDFVLLPYTGFRDKCGQEIHKDDIIDVANHKELYDTFYVVKFLYGCWYLVLSKESLAGQLLYNDVIQPNGNNITKVIGNEHTNPELLENKS